MRAAILGVVVVAATLGVTHGPAAGFEAAPKLELVDTRPVTTHGSGFRSHERIRVVLRRPSGVSRRRARADADGAFSATFPSAMIDRCGTFSIRAKGHAGSRATLLRRQPATCIPP
jgi:hypothetical protein